MECCRIRDKSFFFIEKRKKKFPPPINWEHGDHGRGLKGAHQRIMYSSVK